jgi:hypothetical protein
METFGGGVPVIAIDGTNRPGLMGGARSNGCIRIPNETVRFLAKTVPTGHPGHDLNVIVRWSLRSPMRSAK